MRTLSVSLVLLVIFASLISPRQTLDEGVNEVLKKGLYYYYESQNIVKSASNYTTVWDFKINWTVISFDNLSGEIKAYKDKRVYKNGVLYDPSSTSGLLTTNLYGMGSIGFVTLPSKVYDSESLLRGFAEFFVYCPNKIHTNVTTITYNSSILGEATAYNITLWLYHEANYTNYTVYLYIKGYWIIDTERGLTLEFSVWYENGTRLNSVSLATVSSESGHYKILLLKTNYKVSEENPPNENEETPENETEIENGGASSSGLIYHMLILIAVAVAIVIEELWRRRR